jgi:hypothetical protein
MALWGRNMLQHINRKCDFNDILWIFDMIVYDILKQNVVFAL